LGLIDDKGEKLKKPYTEKEKSAYNTFHRLVFNIKKLINKVPGGKSKIASYASALYLIKEKLNLSDKSLEKILREGEVDLLDIMAESTQWFCTQDGMLSPGIYKLEVSDKMINSTCEEFGKKFDKIRIEQDCYPVTNLFGLDVYEATHVGTGQSIYITAGELSK
jgi:hypothetical protein